jgi:hypothetical protein
MDAKATHDTLEKAYADKRQADAAKPSAAEELTIFLLAMVIAGQERSNKALAQLAGELGYDIDPDGNLRKRT